MELTLAEAVAAQNPWWASGGPSLGEPHSRRRDGFDELRKRVLDLSERRATLLLGPRQVGKSSLLRQVGSSVLADGWPAANLTFFDYSDDRVRPLIRSLGPRVVVDQIPANADPAHPRLILLDEIHWVSDWPFWLKAAIDEDRRRERSMLRILATDSAASVLRQGSVESGQGRWTEQRIWSLTFREYLRLASGPAEIELDVFRRSPQELERYLAKGGLPEHVHAEPSEELRRTIREDIAHKAIERDLLVRDDGPQRGEQLDVDRLRQLFVYLAQDSGAIFTATERARDVGAHHATAARWVHLLVDACLLHRIEPFFPTRRGDLPKASRRLGAKPKLYVSDHGLIPAFTLSAFPMSEARVRAKVFEAAVLRHLVELAGSPAEIRYYRRGDLEVDFVVRLGSRLLAIEVTSSSEVSSEKLRALARGGGQDEIAADECFLIHGGALESTVNDVRLLPLHRFLLEPSILIHGANR